MKPLSDILQSRGCDEQTAEIAARVVAREIRGDKSNRTDEEQQAMDKAWQQLDTVIAGYGQR